jgi:hypothetical protein
MIAVVADEILVSKIFAAMDLASVLVDGRELCCR